MTALLALGSRISDVNVLAYLAAVGGGVVSFLSPCVLPLVPGYLSMVTGLDIATLEDGASVHTRRIVGTTALFVAGFGTVFVLLGLTAASIGQPLRDHQAIAHAHLGHDHARDGAVPARLAVPARAVAVSGEAIPSRTLGRYGVAAPLVAGAAFGFGWSPCIGPILGSILGIAATQQRVWAGGTLLAVVLDRARPAVPRRPASRCDRVGGALGWVKRHFPLIVVGSAVVLGGVRRAADVRRAQPPDRRPPARASPTRTCEWLVNLG